MAITATDIVKAPWLSFGAWPREITEEFQVIRQQLLTAMTQGQQRDRTGNYESVATVILSNLLAPHSEVYRWRSSRSHVLNGGEFDNPAQLTQSQVIKTIKAVMELGWIEPIDFNLVNELIPGKAANRFAITDTCPRLADPLVITYHPNSNFVFCRRDPLFEGFENEEGNWGYAEEEVIRDRALLQRYNAMISNTVLSLDGNVLAHSSPLRRLFKEDDEGRVYRNGRFFGGAWQNMRKVDRPRLLIDGQRTVELDFSAMFPRALYHSLGMEYEGDPYEIGGLDRKLWKAVFQIALNASKQGRNTALRNKLDKDFREENELQDQVRRVRSDPKHYFQVLENYHPQLAGHLYDRRTSDQLMWRESKVAKRLLTWAVQVNTPLLPIHDSFIVTVDQRGELEAGMRMSYRDEFGFNPVIR